MQSLTLNQFITFTMQSLNNDDAWTQSISNWNQDFQFGTNPMEEFQTQNCQNMLVNLSKNLVSFENSYKKHFRNIKNLPESNEHLLKRRIKRKKISFSNTENEEPNNIQQNKVQSQNSQKTNFQYQDKQKERQANNMTRLRKMFEIFNEFNTLNDSILPFKVNLNKISQKRIIANMNFKEMNLDKESQPSQNNHNFLRHSTINVQNLKFRKCPIDNNVLGPLKERVYSLNVKNEQQFRKDKKSQSQKFMKNIVSANGQTLGSKQYKSAQLGKKKRAFSLRKPQHHGCADKTIEYIYQNYARRQHPPKTQIEALQAMREKNIKSEMDVRERTNDKFSDSRFFIRREVSFDSKYNGKLLRR